MEKLFCKKVNFLISISTKCHPEKFLVSRVFELWIYFLNLAPLAAFLSYFYMCGSGSVFGIPVWIRIHKAPEYGSNTDPQQCPHHMRLSLNTCFFFLSSRCIVPGLNSSFESAEWLWLVVSPLLWILIVLTDLEPRQETRCGWYMQNITGNEQDDGARNPKTHIR